MRLIDTVRRVVVKVATLNHVRVGALRRDRNPLSNFCALLRERSLQRVPVLCVR